jgi:hypothetical protein
VTIAGRGTAVGIQRARVHRSASGSWSRLASVTSPTLRHEPALAQEMPPSELDLGVKALGGTAMRQRSPFQSSMKAWLAPVGRYWTPDAAHKCVDPHETPSMTAYPASAGAFSRIQRDPFHLSTRAVPIEPVGDTPAATHESAAGQDTPYR